MPKQPKQTLSTIDALKASVGIAKQPKQKPAVKNLTPGKPPAKQPKQEPKTITLADCAREVGINPKVARAKARRNRDDLPQTVNEDGWVFAASAKQKLIEFLQS